MRIASVLVGLLVYAGSITATDRYETKRFCERFSSNGEFFLKADPAKKTVDVFAWANPAAPLWSFEHIVIIVAMIVTFFAGMFTLLRSIFRKNMAN